MTVNAVPVVENGSGTHQRVALDLLRFVLDRNPEKVERDTDELLRLYKSCLRATYGQYPPD
jgi:hypothetical protein